MFKDLLKAFFLLLIVLAPFNVDVIEADTQCAANTVAAGYQALHSDIGATTNGSFAKKLDGGMQAFRVFLPPGAKDATLIVYGVNDQSGLKSVTRFGTPPGAHTFGEYPTFVNPTTISFVKMKTEDVFSTNNDGVLKILDQSLNGGQAIAESESGWLYVNLTMGNDIHYINYSITIDSAVYNAWRSKVNWATDVEAKGANGTYGCITTTTPPSCAATANPKAASYISIISEDKAKLGNISEVFTNVPSKFKVFIPPATTYFSLTGIADNQAEVALVARFGEPPSGYPGYSTLVTAASPTPSFDKTKTEYVTLLNSDGNIPVMSKYFIPKAVTKEESGWLYVDLVGGGIRHADINLSVNQGDFNLWKNSVNWATDVEKAGVNGTYGKTCGDSAATVCDSTASAVKKKTNEEWVEDLCSYPSFDKTPLLERIKKSPGGGLLCSRDGNGGVFASNNSPKFGGGFTRLFVPPGATSINIETYTEPRSKIGSITRFGQHPPEMYDGTMNISKMNSITIAGIPNMATFDQIKEKSYIAANPEGGFGQINQIFRGDPLTEDQAGWVYINFFGETSKIYHIDYYISVEHSVFDPWYEKNKDTYDCDCAIYGLCQDGRCDGKKCGQSNISSVACTPTASPLDSKASQYTSFYKYPAVGVNTGATGTGFKNAANISGTNGASYMFDPLTKNSPACAAISGGRCMEDTPTKLRFFLPPGTYQSNINFFLAQTAGGNPNLWAVARFGQPPSDYTVDSLSSNFNYNPGGLPKDNDYIVRNSGGTISVLNMGGQPLTEGGWLYVALYSNDTWPTSVAHQLYTNKAQYTSWYNAYKGWNSANDPATLIGFYEASGATPGCTQDDSDPGVVDDITDVQVGPLIIPVGYSFILDGFKVVINPFSVNDLINSVYDSHSCNSLADILSGSCVY